MAKSNLLEMDKVIQEVIARGRISVKDSDGQLFELIDTIKFDGIKEVIDEGNTVRVVLDDD